MPALTVKNIPEDLYEHLKSSAHAQHRSINSELIHRLEASLQPRNVGALDLLAAARMLRRQVKATSLSMKDIDAAKKQGRR